MSSVYRIDATPRFGRDFNKLDRAVARRVMKKIDYLAAHPETVAQPLRNLPSELVGLHKYRLGDYRILLWVDRRNQVITLFAVAHRSEIYRNL